MLSTTSTPWFVCNPEYNRIDISDNDDDGYEIHQQAIDVSTDSQSEGEKVEFSIDSDKELNNNDYTDYTKQDETQPKPITFNESSNLTADLDILSSIHFQSSKRVERTEKEGQNKRSSIKYTYFSTSDDDDEIPSQIPVETNETETKVQTKKSSDNKKNKTFDIISPIDGLTYTFKNYNNPKPITQAKYEQLNQKFICLSGKNADAVYPSLPSKKVKVPVSPDYMTHPKKPKKKKEKNEKNEEKQDQTQENVNPYTVLKTTKCRSRQKEWVDPSQLKPAFEPYKWDEIPDNPPKFLERPPVDKEQLPEEFREKVKKQTPSQTYQPKTFKRHVPPTPAPEPIRHVVKKAIPNQAPLFYRKPELYSKEYRAEIRRQKELKKAQTMNDAFNMKETQDAQIEEEEYDDEPIPEDKKGQREYLKAKLEETDIQEWEMRSPAKHLSDEDEFVVENDDGVNDYAIPDELLTDDDEDNVNDFVKPKPVYFDPHETRAVKLRNQTIKQRLALKKMQEKIKEEEDERREMERKAVSQKLKPTLRELARMAPPSTTVEERIKREHETNRKNLRDLQEKCLSAKHKGFIIEREQRELQIKKEQRELEKRDRIAAREAEEKRLKKIHDQKNKANSENYALWKP